MISQLYVLPASGALLIRLFCVGCDVDTGGDGSENENAENGRVIVSARWIASDDRGDDDDVDIDDQDGKDYHNSQAKDNTQQMDVQWESMFHICEDSILPKVSTTTKTRATG